MSDARAVCKNCQGKLFTALVPGHTVYTWGAAEAVRALNSRAG